MFFPWAVPYSPGTFIVISEGSTDPAKISALPDFPIPLNVNEVQSFLVIFSCYLRFVPEFTILGRPISNMMQMSQLFSCGDELQRSFEALKILRTKSCELLPSVIKIVITVINANTWTCWNQQPKFIVFTPILFTNLNCM
jgi:hypothetical protein